VNEDIMRDIFKLPPLQAWEKIFDHLWHEFSGPISSDVADAITTGRDRDLAALDNLLAGSAWDLWSFFETSAPRTSEKLRHFWSQRSSGKAIFIMDALSLREAPWCIEQAKERGFSVHQACATASELPGDTTPFAKALGFGQRSSLEHNQGKSSDFPNAWTESNGVPFEDCTAMIKADPNIIYWHHWPDSQMHDLADDGDGYRTLAKTAAEQLVSDEFWSFVEKLATGRRVIITADHGYAHSGLFQDVTEKEQASFLKTRFKSGRATPKSEENSPHHWIPPLTQTLSTQHGNWDFVLGRRKWKSQGGYPTLTHGGLSLLEVAVPYIELSR
jgi:hypothetical protein